jgi:hypothetical protein
MCRSFEKYSRDNKYTYIRRNRKLAEKNNAGID